MNMANDGGCGNDSGVALREEIVDPLEQLAMSLAWEEDYSDEYKRRVSLEAFQFAALDEQRLP